MTLRGVLDYIGITRPADEPNWLQKLIARRRGVLLDVLSGFLVLLGISVVAGNAVGGNSPGLWIGGGVIVMGLASWLLSIVLEIRAARDSD